MTRAKHSHDHISEVSRLRREALKKEWVPLENSPQNNMAGTLLRLKIFDWLTLDQDECLRVLKHNGFRDPEFQYRDCTHWRQYRCLVTGPDGEKHNAREVLSTLLRAFALDLLCRDRSSTILDLMHKRPPVSE